MGRHDADPAERRRYTGRVLVGALVLVMLLVGLVALHALSHA